MKISYLGEVLLGGLNIFMESVGLLLLLGLGLGWWVLERRECFYLLGFAWGLAKLVLFILGFVFFLD